MLDYTSKSISVRRKLFYSCLKYVFKNSHIPSCTVVYRLFYDVYDALIGSMNCDFSFFVSNGYLKKDSTGYFFTDKLFVDGVSIIRKHDLDEELTTISLEVDKLGF